MGQEKRRWEKRRRASDSQSRVHRTLGRVRAGIPLSANRKSVSECAHLRTRVAVSRADAMVVTSSLLTSRQASFPHHVHLQSNCFNSLKLWTHHWFQIFKYRYLSFDNHRDFCLDNVFNMHGEQICYIYCVNKVK